MVTLTLLLAITFSGTFLGRSAEAACTSPAAEAGARKYFSGPKTYKLCDGTNWIEFKTNTSLAACTGAGKMDWDVARTAYKVCDGTNYIEVNPTCNISSLTYRSKLTDATNLLGPVSILLSPNNEKAYVVPYTGGKIAVLDVSQSPAAPTLLGVGAGTTFADESQTAVIQGNYLFATARLDLNLAAFDISTNTPTYVSRVQSNPTDEMTNLYGVAIGPDPRYAFTVSWDSGATSNKCFLHVINISNPAAMTIDGKLNVTDAGAAISGCNSIKIRGNIAFLSFGEGAIGTVDISNPTFPRYLSKVTNANWGQGQGFDFTKDGNGVVGATFANSRFNTFNVTDPSSMTWTTSLTNSTVWNGSYFTKVVGDYAFTAGFNSNAVAAVNISNLASPTVAASLVSATDLNGAEHLTTKGRYVYTTNYSGNSVSVLDMGCDPTPTYTLGTCSALGRIEYFPTARAVAYCDGADYRMLAQADVKPSFMNWSNFLDVSEIASISGISNTIDLRFSYVNTNGAPTVQYRKNSGSWTTFTTGAPANVSVTNTDTIEFQVSGTTNHSATITVTNLSDNSQVIDTVVGTVDHNYFYYVPNNGVTSVGVYQISSTGALTAITGSPFTVASNPYSVVVDPQQKFLYVTFRSTNNIRVYNINQSTGAIGTEISGSPYATGTGPRQLTITPDGKFLYVGNYGGNSISAFTVNTTTGQLTAVSGSPYAVGSGALTDVQADPSSRFLYATCDVNTNNLYGYSINTTTGALTALSGFPYTPGRTPQTVDFDGTGTYVYTANWGDNQIGGYSFNSTTGALTLISGSPWTTGTRPNSVITDKLGKLVFSGNSTANTITNFRITSGTGALTSVATGSFTGTNPWEVQLEPRGRFMYSVNKTGNNITGMAFEATGPSVALVPGSPFATSTGPQSGGFAKLPRP